MIPVSKPIIAKNAQKYLLECLNSGWVSSKGPFVEKFEKAFASYVGTKYAVATSSGTSALHLSLAALNIGTGDEVIVPSLTMIAAVLPVIYMGATPVLVDVDPETGNIDPKYVLEKITKKTRAIIVVHLNGHPSDLKPFIDITKSHNLAIIEDAAEAHGAEYRLTNRWKVVGSIGDLGCFSFYGNKIITTGEGGMVTTNDKKLSNRVRSLRNLSRTEGKHFLHTEVAFAYRMSNLQAALGLAQLEQAEKMLKLKNHLASIYQTRLTNISYIMLPTQKSYAKRIYWNYDILVTDALQRDKLAKFLEQSGIETRIFVIPLNKQPALLNLGLFKNEAYPVSEKLADTGLSLPLGVDITEKEISYICNQIEQFFKIK